MIGYLEGIWGRVNRKMENTRKAQKFKTCKGTLNKNHVSLTQMQSILSQVNILY